MNLIKYTYKLVKQIPEEKVSTYGAVAKALGDIRASRAVGKMMKQNPKPNRVPCYKIVHSDGRVGKYNLGKKEKIRRLKQDNIKIKNNQIVNLKKFLFNDFKTNFPLKKLRKKQIKLKNKVKTKNHFGEINKIAGFDVSYPKNIFKKAIVAAVVMDYKTKNIVDKKILSTKSFFPYIPTYLSFREKPLIKKIIKKIEVKPDISMIDGNGILHPYNFGLASHIGVELGIPTIGVAKNLLCGKLRNKKVYIEGEIKGQAYFNSKKIKNPIFVSPGHKIDLSSSIKIVKKLSQYKIPEPVRQAHILAKTTLKS